MDDDPHQPLRDDVRHLGAILGETLRQRGGQHLLETVERVRALAKEARRGEEPEFGRLGETLASMPVAGSVPVARAFSQFLSLANIAEQHHRLRRRRAYRSDPAAAPQPGSLDGTFADLLEAGVDPDELRETVAALGIELVLTAHPTEAARRTILMKDRRIARLLADRDRPDLSTATRARIERDLRRVVLERWETDEVRHERPTPLDEVRWGLVVVEQTLWDVVPAFLRELDRVLEDRTGSPLGPEVAPVRFASWMGGDRDGNPRVTPAVTEKAILLSRWMAASLFHGEIERLRDELSVGVATPELRERVGGAREPYRELLRDLRDRLAATRRATEERLHAPGAADRGAASAREIRTAEDLLEPLRTAHRSLTESGLPELARGGLLDVIRRAVCFGPTLLRLDIRQDSARHTEALDAVTRALGLGSYREWDEADRIRFLGEELASKRPLVPRDLAAGDEVSEVLDTFAMAARQPRDALGAYVVSMCRSPSDVLAVALLQKESAVEPPLRVVPLFETEEDLMNAGEVLDRLFAVESYRKRIRDRQEVMIGYSDSSKDSGRLAAAWRLFTAEEGIVEACRRHGIRGTIFHGRGGSIGRGGGPIWHAIRSQPPGSIRGRLRITEQGEMIQAKFGLPGIATRTLELYVSGVVAATLRPADAAKPEWRETMERIARDSSRAYRRCVREDPGFLEYFHRATPIEELSHLRIGSRPARRKPGRDIESLRAIPWIFAWTQMRLITPTWLGFGESVGAALGSEDRETVLAMYRDWPFFRSTVDLIEMALAKTSPRIAAAYDSGLVPEELREHGRDLRRRRDEAVAAILALTGHDRLLAGNPVLRRSIDVRNPYVDPINLLQIELLRRLREEPEGDEEVLTHALVVTVNGIATGMRNTG